MDTLAPESAAKLTEKEKQVLRLIVRGHDAKSIARCLDLSIHTINERLRHARRKLAVSSSREAARLLLEAESDGPLLPPPNSLGDKEIGEDASSPASDQTDTPQVGVGRSRRSSRFAITGVVIMTLSLALLALATMPHGDTASLPVQATTRSATAEFARQWLALLDEKRWDESYRETSKAFKNLNTAEVWAATSREGRAPFGAAISRTLLSEENLPAPPSGYRVVKFQTRFADGRETVETVTLDRDEGQWRVAGVTIG